MTTTPPSEPPPPSSQGRPTPAEQPGGELRLVVDAACDGLRLDRALVLLLRKRDVFVTRVEVQRLIATGMVELEGESRPLRNRDDAYQGMALKVWVSAPPRNAAAPDPSIRFEILFEDEHLMLIDKPPGLVVHPARGHADDTLVNGLLALPDFAANNADPRDPAGHLRPGIVHRIDKDTSGVMVVAKHAAAREGLKALFAAHHISRQYLALVQGDAQAARYDTPFGRHPKSRMRFTSKLPRASAGVRRAITEVAPVQHFRAAATLVRCTLQTGRTHQIRVHLAEQSNTPVLADALYGRPPRGDRLEAAAAAIGRQALHAAVLGFEHPITHLWVGAEAAVPADMQRALDLLTA